MKFKDFEGVKNFLEKTIPSSLERRFPGEVGLERTRYFLSLLDNPQEKYGIVHIAGTSGKGSIGFILSHLLSSVGFRTGLTLSPHLVDLRERVQINNRLISKEKFVRYFNEIMPAFWKTQEKFGYGPTYFELLTVLAFYAFKEEKVDFGVVETGMGGEYDATNVINNSKKVCVISRIGFDHMHVLGNTLEEIAKQKLGIIQRGNKVVYLYQDFLIPLISKIIESKKAEGFPVNEECFDKVKISEEGTEFRFKCGCYRDKNIIINTSLLGEFQVWNISLALSTLCVLSSLYSFGLESNVIKRSLSNLEFRGRFHMIKNQKYRLILDGAHNSQKMEAFISSLKKIFPGRKFIFLVAFKKKKKFREMMKMIAPLAKRIIITSFSKEKAVSPIEIARATEFKNKAVEEDLERALKLFFKDRGDKVVTGSLYLLGEVYGRMGDNLTYIMLRTKII